MSAKFLPEDVLARDERLQELLCDQAINGLDPIEQAELERALAGRSERGPTFEQTAAIVHLACVRPADVATLPDSVRAKLLEAGEQWCNERRAVENTAGPSLRIAQASDAVLRGRESRRTVGPTRSLLPWLVAAVATIAAIVGWFPRLKPSQVPSTLVSGDPVASRAALLASAPADLVRMDWTDWDRPELAGVQGDVVWSDQSQQGYMRFVNLPVLDASRERYQLWIIDARGMEQRVSGGIFNGTKGEMVLPITPAIPVTGVGAFAITIEKSEGTWVSTMKRRVVIAAKPAT
jgi:hypothetical protein